MFIRYNAITKIWEYDSTTEATGRVGDERATWLPLPIDVSQLVGTIPPAQLPANVAYKDQVNIFTQDQSVKKVTPAINFVNDAAAANSKIFKIIVGGTDIYFMATDDSGNAQGYWVFDRAGNIYFTGTIKERGRAVAMGEWQNEPFLASNFATDTGTWVVTNVQTNRYTLIGKTLIWTLCVAGSTLSNANQAVYVKLPNNFIASPYLNMGATSIGLVVSGGVILSSVILASTTNSSLVRLLNLFGSGFAAGELNVYFTFTGEIL